jgi:tyrosine decarboxylase/aspartate 1-decarboxylase
VTQTKRLPETGLDRYEILERLLAFERESHFDALEKNLFDEGPHLTSSPALPWGDAIRQRVTDAYMRFLWGQIWHTGVGARKMEKQIISMMGDVLGNPNAVGMLTSGGSESNICALVAAKGRAFRKRFPNLDPTNHVQVFLTFPQFELESHSVVMPLHSHYSLFKGCAMLGLVPIPVFPREGSFYQTRPDDLRAAVRDDTIAIVGTAGTWPFGSIDPIAEMGEIAAERDLYFHVDACFGGFIIPFLEMCGYYDPPLAPWDFRVASVASISADLHKNGMLPPGASSLYFRDHDTRVSARMLSPPFGNLSGSRGTAPIAASWAMLMSLGIEGYKAVASHSIGLQDQLRQALPQIPGLQILPDSKINLTVAYSDEYDLRPVVKALGETDWGVVTDPNPPPVGLCICCMPQNDGQIEAFVEALKRAIDEHAVPLGTLGDDYEFNMYGLNLD